MEVTVRPGTFEDADTAFRLYQAHLNWINVWFEPSAVVQRKITIERMRARFEETPCAVATFHGQIVGYAVTSLREPKVLDISSVYVDDPYRKKGVGTRLLIEIERLAADQGVEALIATGSAEYFPGKYVPEGLFKRLEFEVHTLSGNCQLYIKRLAIGAQEAPADNTEIHLNNDPVVDVTEVTLAQVSNAY